MNTLLLDRSAWDLCIDLNGNIAMAGNPYSIAQDVASAVRTFAGEVWYDTALGLPYGSRILGRVPPLSLLKAWVCAAALSTPDAVSAACHLSGLTDRRLTGQVEVTDASGGTQVVGF